MLELEVFSLFQFRLYSLKFCWSNLTNTIQESLNGRKGVGGWDNIAAGLLSDSASCIHSKFLYIFRLQYIYICLAVMDPYLALVTLVLSD